MVKTTGLKLMGILCLFWMSLGMLTQTVWAQDGQILYYNFENMESALIQDASGNGNDAVVKNYEDNQFRIMSSEIQGKKVNCIELCGDRYGSYLKLPENILSDCESMTVSCWVMLYTDTGYQRIWDFGNGQRDYMYLLSNGSNQNAIGYACAATLEGWKGERCLSMGTDFPRYEWVFTTVTMEENQMALYLNGEEIGSRQMDVPFSKVRDTKYNYIGYGQFDDTPVNGCFAEFSVFNYAMTQQEIQYLYQQVQLEKDVSEREASQVLYNYYMNYDEEPVRDSYLMGNENPVGNFRGCAAGEYLTYYSGKLQDGQEEARQRLIYMVDELARLQEKSQTIGWETGFLSCYKPENWTDLKQLYPYPYTGNEFREISSLLEGLLCAYQADGYEKSLAVAKKLADWLMDYSAGYAEAVWQQEISEPWGKIGNQLYELYEITEEEKYLTGAMEFVDEKLCEQWRQGGYKLKGKDVSAVLNQAMLLWKLSENPECTAYVDLDEALKRLWGVIVKEHSYVNGIIGWNQHFVGKEEYSVHANSPKSFYEEGIEDMLKFTWLLYENDWENCQYLNYVEQVLCNIQNDNTEAYLKYVFQKEGETGNILLYIDSDYTWEEKGLQFRQTANWMEGVVNISVEEIPGYEASEVNLKFRVPEYVQSKPVFIKNHKEEIGKMQDDFLTVEHIGAGDELEIRMPYAVWIGPALQKYGDYQLTTIMYGPFVMTSENMEKAETIQILNRSLKELQIIEGNEPEVVWDKEKLQPFYKDDLRISYFKLFIKATESENWYHVNIQQDDTGKGVLQSNCELVKEGNTVTLTAYPKEGYQIYEVRAGGEKLYARSNNVYLVDDVHGELDISVRFATSNPLQPDLNALEQSATVSAHYTASWENLTGVQDANFEPASSNEGTGKGWGDWYQKHGETVWIQYSWEVDVPVDTCEIYWYVDDRDTGVPSELSVEYLEDGKWKPAVILTKKDSYYKTDTYNTVSIQPIVTRDLRLVMTVSEENQAVGIYKWKVSGKKQQ